MNKDDGLCRIYFRINTKYLKFQYNVELAEDIPRNIINSNIISKLVQHLATSFLIIKM